MSDFLLLGIGSRAINPEGSVSWDKSIEAGNYAVIVTKSFTPQGLEGDALFRRVYITVEHESGIAIGVTPVVDGVKMIDNTCLLARPAPEMGSKSERYTFVLPLFTSVYGRTGKIGVRGTTISLEISAHNPKGDWWVENVGFMISAGSRAKKED